MILLILEMLKDKGAFMPVASLLIAIALWVGGSAYMKADAASEQAMQAGHTAHTTHEILLRVERNVDRLVDHQLSEKD